MVWDPEQKVLLSILYDEESKRVESLTDEQIMDEVQEEMKKTFGGSINFTSYRPTGIKLNRWSQDKRFGGAWSAFPDGCLSTKEEYEDYQSAVTSG